MSLPVKEFWKSVNIWGNYGQEFGVLFFWDTVYIPRRLARNMGQTDRQTDGSHCLMLALWRTVYIGLLWDGTERWRLHVLEPTRLARNMGQTDRQTDRQTDGQTATLLNARAMTYGLYTGLLWDGTERWRLHVLEPTRLARDMGQTDRRTDHIA